MWPDLPSSRKGGLVIQMEVDEECQARLVTKDGEPWGCALDDTTENAEHDLDYYVALAVAKYGPLGQKVLVFVPPGQAGLHHKPSPPIVNCFEWYPYGMGVPRSAWPKLPPKGYRAYCVQWRYPGTESKRAPTRRQRLILLARVMLRRPEIVFLF